MLQGLKIWDSVTRASGPVTPPKTRKETLVPKNMQTPSRLVGPKILPAAALPVLSRKHEERPNANGLMTRMGFWGHTVLYAEQEPKEIVVSGVYMKPQRP